MNYTKKAVHGVITIFLVSILSGIVGYLFRILLARTLTIYEYGLIFSIFSFFGLFSLFFDLGLSTALTKYIAKFKAENDLKSIKHSIIIVFVFLSLSSLIVGILSIVFSGWIAATYIKDASSQIYIILYSIALMFTSLLIFSSIFLGFQKPFFTAIIDLIRMSLILIFSAIMLYFGMGLISPFFAYILAFLICGIIFYILFIKKVFPTFWKIPFKLDKKLTKELFLFGSAVLLTGAAGIIFNYTDSIMITYFKGLKEAALYNASYPTAKFIWGLTAALSMILLPLSAELWAKKDIQKIKDGFKMVLKYSLILVIPASLIFALYSEFILNLLFGKDYVAGANVLRLLALGTIFYTISQINNSMLTGIGKPKIVGKIMIFTAILNVIGNLVLIPTYGMMGATISTVICFGIIMLTSHYSLSKHIKTETDIKDIILIIINSLIFLGAIYIAKNLFISNMWSALFFSALFGIMIYTIGLFLFRIVTISEIKLLLGRLK